MVAYSDAKRKMGNAKIFAVVSGHNYLAGFAPMMSLSLVHT